MYMPIGNRRPQYYLPKLRCIMPSFVMTNTSRRCGLRDATLRIARSMEADASVIDTSTPRASMTTAPGKRPVCLLASRRLCSKARGMGDASVLNSARSRRAWPRLMSASPPGTLLPLRSTSIPSRYARTCAMSTSLGQWLIPRPDVPCHADVSPYHCCSLRPESGHAPALEALPR